MAGVFAQLQVILRAAEDFEQTKKIFENNPPDSMQLDDAELSAGAVSQVINIPGLASEQPLEIGGVTNTKIVLIITDGRVDLRLAALGTAIPIGFTGKVGWFLLVGDGPTSLLVSNAGTTPRKLRYYVAGS